MQYFILATTVFLVSPLSYAQEISSDLALAGKYYENSEWEEAAKAYRNDPAEAD